MANVQDSQGHTCRTAAGGRERRRPRVAATRAQRAWRRSCRTCRGRGRCSSRSRCAAAARSWPRRPAARCSPRVCPGSGPCRCTCCRACRPCPARNVDHHPHPQRLPVMPCTQSLVYPTPLSALASNFTLPTAARNSPGAVIRLQVLQEQRSVAKLRERLQVQPILVDGWTEAKRYAHCPFGFHLDQGEARTLAACMSADSGMATACVTLVHCASWSLPSGKHHSVPFCSMQSSSRFPLRQRQPSNVSILCTLINKSPSARIQERYPAQGNRAT